VVYKIEFTKMVGGKNGARKRPKADIVVIGVYEAENKEKNLETN